MRFVAISLEPVAVRVDYEGGVVVVAIGGAQAGPAIVLATRKQGRRMESVDAGACRCGKAEMQAGVRVGRDRPAGLIDPEFYGPGAVAERAG